MEERPIIDTDRRFKTYDENGERNLTIIPLGIWVDEDGNTQVRINDNWSRKITVTPDDIYEMLDNAHDYDIIK